MDYDNRNRFSIVSSDQGFAIRFAIHESKDVVSKFCDLHQSISGRTVIWRLHNSENDKMQNNMPGLLHNGTRLLVVLNY